MKIKKITRVHYKGKVHNFGTPPVHTYYANGVLVHNCYTNATGGGKHMTPAQLEKIITGFHEPPYQIAFGGGSPTSHPEFQTMLSLTAELGVVPNYTTEGEGLTKEILDATRRYCGGVALTYHRRKNETEDQTAMRFADRYQTLKDAGVRQVNVHVIAGRSLLEDLASLLVLSERLGSLNIVLLAYYPGVGRDDGTNLLSIRQFDKDLPLLIRSLEKSGSVVAYSQGLLPYFKSRPELGKASHTHIMEGFMTAAVDVDGHMTSTSFERPDVKYGYLSTFDVPSQLAWITLRAGVGSGSYECRQCKFDRTCGGSHEDTLTDLCRYTVAFNQILPSSGKSRPRNHDEYRWERESVHIYDYIFDSSENGPTHFRVNPEVQPIVDKYFPGALCDFTEYRAAEEDEELEV